ncbi:bile acid:sodium symporter family protein [Actinophytocola xanthii]|uniref:Bile acid:sodium symporter n=1 Tax=Actinophytocola xanthii TaxID=1912961 RepID=A0A1Q8CXH2_9PSEU|nr:bile acid:sodium symporter family protein [Actinophytocola xanthii]OLF19050.1 bile acid:sodium symporter [Actinophytocola xanthii]
MNSSTATTVFLPIALGVIMLGLGLSLTVADFGRVLRYPRAAAVALGCQILVLPALCLGLVLLFDLQPTLAVGMMLLAASPGGTTANLFSHLAGGDVALNVTLTAVNSVLAVITLPVVVNLAIDGFLDGGDAIGLQPDKLVQVFAIVLVPVALGMLLRNRAPALAERLNRPVKIASVVVLVSVIAVAVYQERDNVLDYVRAVGLVALLLCVASLAVGYLVPRAFAVPRGQAVASSFEIGVHNSTLAITIALSPALLDSPEMAVPPAVYGILSFVPAGLLAYALSRRDDDRALSRPGR